MRRSRPRGDRNGRASLAAVRESNVPCRSTSSVVTFADPALPLASRFICTSIPDTAQPGSATSTIPPCFSASGALRDATLRPDVFRLRVTSGGESDALSRTTCAFTVRCPDTSATGIVFAGKRSTSLARSNSPSSCSSPEALRHEALWRGSLPPSSRFNGSRRMEPMPSAFSCVAPVSLRPCMRVSMCPVSPSMFPKQAFAMSITAVPSTPPRRAARSTT